MREPEIGMQTSLRAPSRLPVGPFSNASRFRFGCLGIAIWTLGVSVWILRAPMWIPLGSRVNALDLHLDPLGFLGDPFGSLRLPLGSIWLPFDSLLSPLSIQPAISYLRHPDLPDQKQWLALIACFSQYLRRHALCHVSTWDIIRRQRTMGRLC